MIDFLVDQLMLPILNGFYQVTGSYGWAIVLLTIVIKFALLPLTMKSHHSMKEMQRIQPKFKQIQERYKSNPEEMNKQVMKLYKEHKVNPLGGCLPILIQMPFLFALYASLIGETFKDLLKKVDPSFFFIPDLARSGVFTDTGVHADNLFMVALFGITTYWQQKIMTAQQPEGAMGEMQSMQKQMMTMMPIMVTGMFLFFPVPSGVFIYLVISNLIGIGQYMYLNVKSEEKSSSSIARIEYDDNGTKSKQSTLDVTEAVPQSREEAVPADSGKRNYTKRKNFKKKKRKR